jgi:hypothetical protein
MISGQTKQEEGRTWLGHGRGVGVWQGVAMAFLKNHLGLPCPTLLHPAGEKSLKWSCDRFKGSPLAWQVACGRLLPFGRPHAVRLWAWGSNSGPNRGVWRRNLITSETIIQSNIEVWSLESGVWSLESGVWSLESGVWSLES